MLRHHQSRRTDSRRRSRSPGHRSRSNCRSSRTPGSRLPIQRNSHNLPAEQTSRAKYSTPQHKRRRSPSPSTTQTPGIHNLPTKWSPSSQYYDINPVHGLTLPKLVSSTFHSRQLGIADMDPLTVPIANIVPFGVENWMIRYMSHGRYIQWEAFRTKREAVVMSHIAKLAREDTSFDFDTIISHMASTQQVDINSWENKYKLYQEVAQQMFLAAKAMMPTTADATLAAKIQALEQENQRLKALAAKPTAAQTPIGRAFQSTPQKQPEPARQRSPSHEPEFPQPSRKRGKYLRSNAPASHTSQAVSTWISKLKMSKEQKKQFDELCTTLSKMAKSAAADGPFLDDLTCEWGLTCSIAASMADSERIKVISAAWVMSS